MTDKIAIVGAGLIGRAWAIVFARAGRHVALYHPDPLVVPAALETIGVNLADLVESGLIADPAETIQRIEPVKNLEAALRGALYVQENGPENLAIKQALFRELDRLANPGAVLGSSSSALRASLALATQTSFITYAVPLTQPRASLAVARRARRRSHVRGNWSTRRQPLCPLTASALGLGRAPGRRRR